MEDKGEILISTIIKKWLIHWQIHGQKDTLDLYVATYNVRRSVQLCKPELLEVLVNANI